MTQLFKYDNAGELQVIGLYDLCEYWIEAYPEDVFVNTPEEVVAIRNLMKKILSKKRN